MAIKGTIIATLPSVPTDAVYRLFTDPPDGTGLNLFFVFIYAKPSHTARHSILFKLFSELWLGLVLLFLI